jgi:tetratricopeptide (TPR) repeat protein
MVVQLRKALRRDPSDRDTLLWLAVVSLWTGQPELGEKLGQEIYRVDPLSPLSPVVVGYCEFFRGRFDEAARYQEESLRLGPDIPVSLWCAVRTFLAAGSPDRAVECAQRLREKDPESPFSESSGLLLSGLDGKSDSMPAASPGLRSWAARDGEWGQYVSDAYAFGGDQEKALEWLELARQGGFYNHIYLTRHDPFVREFAKTAEWKEVMARIVESHRAFEERLVPIEVPF